MIKTNKRLPAKLLNSVNETVVHYGMLKNSDRVLVCVSGGADSVTLLNVLMALRSKLGIKIVVANLDHGIRGKDSAGESLFVKKLAEELNLEFVQEKLRPFKLTSGKRSLEENLREKRYSFFAGAAKKAGCSVIATGHNMDDQAETVLMRVIKGSSIDGLAGIPPVRMEGHLKIIRPLIRTSRREIMAFISGQRKEHVNDSSNDDINFLRNRIRKEILPFLEKINPAIRPALVNISDSAREEILFSLAARKDKVRSLVAASAHKPEISLKKYVAQDRAVRKEIFKELFRSSGGNIKKMAHRHWMLMDNFARTQSKGRSLDLPGNVSVVKSKGKLTFFVPGTKT